MVVDLREVSWTDAFGRHWATLIPTDEPDSAARTGLPLGPVPLDGADPASSFVDFQRPGFAKMAFNFRVDGGELTTETRIFLTNTSARWAFGAYWLVIRPFSGWIRREWLAGITRRAAQTGPTPRG